MAIWLDNVLRIIVVGGIIGFIAWDIKKHRKHPKKYIEHPQVTQEDVDRQIEIEKGYRRIRMR